MWTLAQQQSKKFTSTVSETGRALARFRDIKTLQKFASAHASIHNHFNLDRHHNNRETFKKPLSRVG